MDASTLRSLRSITSTFLTDTCTIERRVKSTGRYGEEVLAYLPVYTGVRCRVITTGVSNQNQMGKVGEQATLKFTTKLVVPVATDLAVNDHILVNGQTYNIVDLLNTRTDATDQQAILERWQAA